MKMTTTVTIKTVDDGKEQTFVVNVTDWAQAKVLRKFNPTEDMSVASKVDASKVLCAALIQQMLDLQGGLKAADEGSPADIKNAAIMRTAAMAISDLEKVQMLCVKANFAEG
jgi:hypothetical protein